MKRTLVLISIAVYVITITAQSAFSNIEQNPNVAGCNYLAYPTPTQPLTPAPNGYQPFYLSHYGRHGSRFLIDDRDYERPLSVLQKADAANALTPLGKDALRRICLMEKERRGRMGELTLLGAEQHRGIARRMFEHFPEIFADSVIIDARSTVVIRCILSMTNELLELQSLNPQLRIRHDASHHDMYYMNQPDHQLDSLKDLPAVSKAFNKFCDKRTNNRRFINALFKDKKYVKKYIDEGQLRSDLFSLATALQNTELRHSITLYDLFTTEELYQNWQMSNAWWHLHFGNSPLSHGRLPYSQRNLLRNIIETADSCLQQPHPGATLRFGHETMVLPLTCLLNLNGYGESIAHPDSLETCGWLSYRIFPMAANIQFVFYRNTTHPNADILMKVLLNENEATLPLPSDLAPYYRWHDFRSYYCHKLDTYHEE